MRDFARAIADFERAALLIEGKPDQVERDGLPNSAGIPTSTLHTNTWYHLGMARFLTGDFAAAETAFHQCLAASDNNDMQVATLDWLYMTLCRLERNQEADKLIQHVTADLKILENQAYHRRLLLYRGRFGTGFQPALVAESKALRILDQLNHDQARCPTD